AYAGAKSAVSNAATQGIGVLTGLQKSFNWRSVATSAVSSAVGAAAASGATEGMKADDLNLGSFGNALAVGTASGLAAGTTAALLHGGRIDVIRIATDAFGNALANSITQELSTPEQQPRGYDRQAPQQQAAPPPAAEAERPELRQTNEQ